MQSTKKEPSKETPSEGQSYANYPKSIAELRVARNNELGNWTCRDVLIEILRDIDEKRIDPDTLCVVFREKKIGQPGFMTTYSCSGTDLMATSGMLGRAIQTMNETDEE